MFKKPWWVHPDTVSLTRGCTPIDLKDDTVAEHPCRPLCSVSLHAVYPAGWLLPQTLDQCGTLWNSLSCRKATTPLQIPSQHTMTASHSVSWEERCLCDQMIKLCWGAVCVTRMCAVLLFSDKCCFGTGRGESCDPLLWFKFVFSMDGVMEFG